MKVSVIGLGNMGNPMATQLIKGGHEVRVYNRSAQKAQPLVSLGATAAADIAQACAKAEVVITMLADDTAVESAAFGDEGIVKHLPRGAVHVSSSTISVELAKRMAGAHAAAGQRFVSAPVMGRPDAATAGKLFVLASGDAGTIRELEPVFQAIGQRTFVIGTAPEQANLVKLSMNFLIACVIESVGEAMALVSKGGIDRHLYLDVMTSTLFSAPAYKTYGKLIADHQYEPAGFAAPLGAKDVRLTLAAAETLGVPLPVASLLRDRFMRLLANGGEHLDWSAIAALSAQDAGT